MIAIRLESKGPVFYVQKRLGYKGKVFNLLKFRSMTDKPRENKQVFINSDEVTITGRFIRRLKIDELPQLINIFIGDMSFIGPRPCLPDLQSKFDENGKYRIFAKPGLSGLAQVNGNIYLSWPERWVYDRYYVKNISFFLDLKILIKTFLIVLLGEEKFKKGILK